MAYASPAEVEVSLGRPLTADEAPQVDGLLARIETRIVRRITDLADQIDLDPTLQDVVVEVEADAVARTLRNPEGYRQEQDGDYMYIRDRAVASGQLELTDKEWARLGISAAAFTIAPSLGLGVDRTWIAPDSWSPA